MKLLYLNVSVMSSVVTRSVSYSIDGSVNVELCSDRCIFPWHDSQIGQGSLILQPRDDRWYYHCTPEKVDLPSYDDFTSAPMSDKLCLRSNFRN